MNQNPYTSPRNATPDTQDPNAWKWVLTASAVLGVAVSCVCLYLALTYPVVRPPDWEGGFRFHLLVAIGKWGSCATILFGGIAFVKLPKSWLNRILLTSAFAPAIMVIGLYAVWLVLFA